MTFLSTFKDPEIANAIRDEVTGRHIYHDMLGFDAALVAIRN